MGKKNTMRKIDPTHPAAEYTPREFGDLIGRNPKWVKETLVQSNLVPFSVVNGYIRLTGVSLQTYIDLRDAGELEDFAVKK